MSTRDDSPQPGTSAATASHVLRDANQGNPICPVCWDIDTECSSSCRHCFCSYCVWDWSLGDPLCPQCQRPARHGFPQHVVLYHEVQDQVYENKRRRRRGFARRARSCSGHGGQDGTPGMGHRGGRWWSQGRNPSRRRRRRRRSREWDDTWDEGRAPRSEWEARGSPRGRRPRHGSQHGSRRPWDQQERPWGHQSRERWRSRRRERSRGWDGQWSRSRRRGHRTWSQGTQPHERSARQRRWRSTNPAEGRAPRHQQHVPGSSGRARYRHRTWSPAGHGTP